jgi:hypothetical protein
MHHLVARYTELANKYKVLSEKKFMQLPVDIHKSSGVEYTETGAKEFFATQIKGLQEEFEKQNQVNLDRLREKMQTDNEVTIQARVEAIARGKANENEERLRTEFATLTQAEKDKISFIKLINSNYAFEGKVKLAEMYNRYWNIYHKSTCLTEKNAKTYPAINLSDLGSREFDIGNNYAKEFIAVEHVFLVLKNLVDPNSSHQLLQNYASEAEELDELVLDKNTIVNIVNPKAQVQEINKQTKIKEHFGDEKLLKICAAYAALKSSLVGHNIVRFYDRKKKIFLTSAIIKKPTNKEDIQVLLTPNEPWLINLLLKRFDFTFTMAFHGMREENNTNLVESVKSIVRGSTNAMTIITFGQSGSGKSTTAMQLLYDLIADGGIYTYSAVQWYLTTDGNTLKTDNVLHDVGKVIENVSQDKYKYVHTTNGDIEAEANKEFKFEVLVADSPLEHRPTSDFGEGFLDKLEKVKLTRTTQMNKLSSRSVLFFTIYGSDKEPKYSLIDLPGNEELRAADGTESERAKETKAIKPVLEMFKSLFLAKKQGRITNLPQITTKRVIEATSDSEETLHGLQGVLSDSVASFELFSQKLRFGDKGLMKVLYNENSKLVLLLTAYGVTKVDNDEPADKLSRIMQTSVDTFDFSKRLDATMPQICELKSGLKKIEGGAKKRSFVQTHKSTKRLKTHRKHFQNIRTTHKR